MSKSTWILIFTKVQLILDELFTIFTTVLIHEFYFFPFCHFRAYFEHFIQSKPTSYINWKLFSMSKSTWILIFTKVQLILDELFTIFTMVLIYEFYFFPFCHFRAYFEHFSQSKSTSFINWKLFSMSKSTWILIFTKVQLILDELFTIFTTVLIYEFYFFHFVTSERILSTLAKVNRLLLLIKNCSAA
jgi:uncharacterized membrane protein